MSPSLIACIGAGTVGRSWAVVFARAGHDVMIWDADPRAMAQARAAIATTLAGLADAGALDDPSATLTRISHAADLETAVRGASYVQESIVERVDAKRTLYDRMDGLLTSGAIIGSSTSAIPGSQFLTARANSARYLVAHPVNPPHLIPLVELCPSPETAPQTIDYVAGLMRAAGQTPIRLEREIEGFLLNRLQWALLSEAMHLVGEGYCSAEDIDAVMTDGLALRWALMGPLAVGHLNAAQGLKGYFEGLGEAIGLVRNSLRTDYVPDQSVIAAAHDVLARHMPLDSLPKQQAKRDAKIWALRSFLDKLR